MDIVHRPSRLTSPPAEVAKSPLAQRRENAGWSMDGTLDPVEVSGRGNFVCGFTQIVALQQQVERERGSDCWCAYTRTVDGGA